MILILLDRALLDKVIQMLLEVLDPLSGWQLSHMPPRPLAVHHAFEHPRVILRLGHLTLEPLEVRDHGHHSHLLQSTHDVVLDYFNVVRRYIATEAGTDTFRSVHQEHGHNRHVANRLHLLPVIHNVFEDRVIGRVEDPPSQRCQAGEDVTGAGCILATRQTRTKLPRRLQ